MAHKQTWPYTLLKPTYPESPTPGFWNIRAPTGYLVWSVGCADETVAREVWEALNEAWTHYQA